MHIVLGILGILTAIGVWSWRLQQAKRGAHEAGKVIEAAVNLPRRMKFRARSAQAGLDVVDDPREAATVMMLEVARADGQVNAEQRKVIEDSIVDHFELSREDAEHLITQAGWLSRNAPAPHAVMERMARIVMAAGGLGREQYRDLEGMLVAVAEADGIASYEQTTLINIFANRVGLAH